VYLLSVSLQVNLDHNGIDTEPIFFPFIDFSVLRMKYARVPKNVLYEIIWC